MGCFFISVDIVSLVLLCAVFSFFLYNPWLKQRKSKLSIASSIGYAKFVPHVQSRPISTCRKDISIGKKKYNRRQSALFAEDDAGRSFPSTTLPDNLEDAAVTAAAAVIRLSESGGKRMRIDYDTRSGDETFSALKTTAPFVLLIIRELCSRIGEGADRDRRVLVRVYFPDEGAAALARRDWNLPKFVQLSSLGGSSKFLDISNDEFVIFLCPQATEAAAVESAVQRAEECMSGKFRGAVLVNPYLVDMAVTGMGYAGRELRKRFLESLIPAYYLRSVATGAIARTYPCEYSIWAEDSSARGGYRFLQNSSRLPSNDDLEELFYTRQSSVTEGGKGDFMEPSKRGRGLLDVVTDFIQGMTRL